MNLLLLLQRKQHEKEHFQRGMWELEQSHNVIAMAMGESRKQVFKAKRGKAEEEQKSRVLYMKKRSVNNGRH